jgi:hypothetical protein
MTEIEKAIERIITFAEKVAWDSHDDIADPNATINHLRKAILNYHELRRKEAHER